jgi:predicted metal-dependent phosphoesterase TrpH
MIDLRAELHCHTRFSDGRCSPEECIRHAARRGLQVIAITDHNTAEGGLPYWKAPDADILVIPGEEISTDRGHLLAYFVRETIPPGPFEKVIAAVQEQDALGFMAHPIHIPIGNRWRKKPTCHIYEEDFQHLDGIEIENGHNRSKANRRARMIADQYGIPSISGSDAHFSLEIGNAETILTAKDRSLDAVREALESGHFRALPRRFSGFPFYLAVGLMNRLARQHYAYKESLL